MRRLVSLDVLRGADMVLLTVVGPLVWGMDEAWGLPAALTRQFGHEWGSLYLWDLVMPLFIFICGASVPLALPRRLEADGRPGPAYWRHVLGRVALLWALGLVVQGNLLKLSLDELYPYCNTLQAIAAGYLIAALAMPIRSRAVRFALPFALAAVYSLPLAVSGDYTPEGNFAQVVEMGVLRAMLPATSKVLEHGTWGYTWFWTSLMFGAMTLAGSASTEILREEAWSARRRALTLALAGAGCVALGFVLMLFIPPIKHIYSASFTALAVGASMLLYAGLYAAFDMRGAVRGPWLVMLFGQCALAAYVVNNVFYGLLDAIGVAVATNTGRIADGDVPFYRAVVHVALLTAVVWAWGKTKERRKKK